MSAIELPREFQSCDVAPSLAGSSLTLHHGGESFAISNKAKRAELLEMLAAGELVELGMDFRAFQQIEGQPNRNFLKFSKGILRQLARSFDGVPLLRDHDAGSLDARAGTVTKSRAVKVDGGLAFDMSADVTAPFAVEALLRGNFDRFSIGWAHGGLDTILCSNCGCPVFSECFHLPGDKVENEKTGRVDVVEFVFTEAEGTEVSAVSVPAVTGTGITDVRAALSLAATAARNQREDQPMDLKKIALSLGLPDDASEETILAAVAARDEAANANAQRVEELSSSNAELQTAVRELQQRDAERGIDAVFARFADRIPIARDADGKIVENPLVAKLRAIGDAGAIEGILSSMPKVDPTTGELQSLPSQHRQPTDERPEGVPAGVPWNGDIKRALELTGQSIEDYVRNGPHNGAPKLKFYNGVRPELH